MYFQFLKVCATFSTFQPFLIFFIFKLGIIRNSILIDRSMRNPFTSVTNISFMRNTSRMAPQTKDSYVPRSLSSHKYFDYKPSYMHDSYLLGYDSRKQQENQYCRVMGLEAMRYRPDPPPIDNEYYAIQNHQTLPPEEESKPFDNCTTDVNSNTVHSAMKNTKDMFGSDYFSNRIDSSEADEIAPKKPAIKKKITNESSKIRFKKVIEVNCPQLSEESSQLQDSMLDENANKMEEEQCKIQLEDPKTIYLKCKKRIFYLYEQEYRLI